MLIVLIAVTMYQWTARTGAKAEELKYNEFVKQVDNGNVRKLILQQERLVYHRWHIKKRKSCVTVPNNQFSRISG